MPLETLDAIRWALQQTITDPYGNTYNITLEMSSDLVNKVREFFNENNIEYSTFSYDDLIPYLKDMGLLN